MKRNSRGFLPVTDLKDGAVEQWADLRLGFKRVVEMGWKDDSYGGTYFVRFTHETGSSLPTPRLMAQTYETFDKVDDARSQFTRLVETHRSTR